MGRRRRRKSIEYNGKSTQAILDIVLEWRINLSVNHQFAPDIDVILKKPTTEFPHITVNTFNQRLYRNKDVRGWANSKARTIDISSRVKNLLRYGDPDARWDATHELAHVALGHPGNNLLAKPPYTALENRLEAEVETFTLNFLAPFHLARNLQTVDDYVTRFRIPRDKAQIRKIQVDTLKKQSEILETLRSQLWDKKLDNDRQGQQLSSPIAPHSKRQKRAPKTISARSHAKQLGLFDWQIDGSLERSIGTETFRKPENTSRPSMNSSISSEKTAPPEIKSRQIDFEDRQIIEILLQHTNNKIVKRRRFLKFALAFLIFFIGALPMANETIDGLLKISSLLISGITAAVFVFFQILDKPIRLDAKIERWAWATLQQLATTRGITKKLQRYEVEYRLGTFRIKNAPMLPLPFWLTYGRSSDHRAG